MKSVNIPSWNNPFVVTVNGEKYSYPGGSTVEVPDEVAEMIENIIANMPAENKNYSTSDVFDCGGKKIRNAAPPVLDGDVVNKGYLENRLSGKESLPNKVSSVSGIEKNTSRYPSVKAMTDYVESVIDKNVRFTIASLNEKASASVIQTSTTKILLRVGFDKDAFTFTLTGDDAWNLKAFEVEDQTLTVSDFDTLISQFDGYESLSISRKSEQGVVAIDREYSFDTAEHASAAYAELGGGSSIFTAFTIALENAPTEEAVLKEE